MIRAAIPALGLCALLVGGTVAEEYAPDQGRSDSLRAAMLDQLARLTSPELESRKARRRLFQQRGYADILRHAVRHDGPGTLLAYFRMALRLELALPHDRLFLFVPVRSPDRQTPGLPGFTGVPSGPLAIPLEEPKEFPRDPWKRPPP